VTRIPARQIWTVYLPGAAKNALTHASYSDLNSDLNVLQPWQGGLLFAGYGIAPIAKR
jgi:hypothetical protein